jgi:transposase
VTETCDPATPHLLVQVTTTPGAVADETMLLPIQEDLAERDLLPETHLVDSGYIDADVLATSHARCGIDVLGPSRGNYRWQAQEQSGFEGHHFAVDWDAERAICPQGHSSTSWTVNYDRRHGQARQMISVRFAATDCRQCPSRDRCTRQTRRTMTWHPREQELAWRRAREREQTDAFAATYGQRAGVEGTHSQGLRVCDLRHARYLGQAKTHLQHLIAATALNLLRICAWLDGTPTAPTRQSTFTRLMTQAA